MPDLDIYFETEFPEPPEANSIYIVNPPGENVYCEIYVVGNSPSDIRRTIKESEILEMVSGLTGAPVIVSDIPARDSLDLDTGGNSMVLVTDATGDATVDAGWALYLWNDSQDVFLKINEYESMDVEPILDLGYYTGTMDAPEVVVDGGLL